MQRINRAGTCRGTRYMEIVGGKGSKVVSVPSTARIGGNMKMVSAVASSKRGKPRKSRRIHLPISSGSGPEPTFEPSSEQWAGIEAAYGQKLPFEYRSKIIQIINEYFRFEPSERNAPFVEDAVRWLNKICDCSESLFHSLQTISEGKIDVAANYAANIVDRHVNENPHHNGNDVTTIARRLADFAACCCLARNTLEMESKKNGFVEGHCWNLFVYRLILFACEQGLPVSASKGLNVSKTGKPSPFVAFVSELQKCFPEDYPRHNASLQALATAISNVLADVRRRETNLPKNSAPISRRNSPKPASV
jgi:hypothetical protein